LVLAIRLGEAGGQAARSPVRSQCWSYFTLSRITSLISFQHERANFDVSHELDEFILAEKPLTHHKRKANPEKMKPDMRQLEDNFTMYDFERTGRRSYYPLNEPLGAHRSHDGRTSSRPTFSSASSSNTYVQSGTTTSQSRSSTSHSEPLRHSSQQDRR